MAKHTLMLGFLWAVGCGMSSVQSTTTNPSDVTTTPQTTKVPSTTASPAVSNSAPSAPTSTIKTTLPSSTTGASAGGSPVQSAKTATTASSGTSASTSAQFVSTKPTTSSNSQSASLPSNAVSITTKVINPTGPTQATTNPSQSKPPSEGPAQTAQSTETKQTTSPVAHSPLPNIPASVTTDKTKPSESPGKTSETTIPAKITSSPGRMTLNPAPISVSPSTIPAFLSQNSTRPSQSIGSTSETPGGSANPAGPTLKVPFISTTAKMPSLESTTLSITGESKPPPQQPIQIHCENKTFNEHQLKINIKMDGPLNCNQDNVGNLKDKVEQVCKAIKPGFQASTDVCKVVLAYNTRNENQLAVMKAVVETTAPTNDLYSKLKTIRNEDGTPMFEYQSKLPNTEYDDWLSMTLIITIVCLAASLLIIAAIYGCWHQRRSQKRDQRLTEELQTMENGYHDNPTLEVMETSPEMQEKKGGLNGELGDSWIVPLDNLTREDLDEEEDTHL
uniref:Podocalyxin n=1 Tax=Leptobrachium leishanense TaxID=445787 RepID=A0A8C5MFC3_9ANUR